MTRRLAVPILVAALALTGCSDGDQEPSAKPRTTAATQAPTLSPEEARAACVDAWAETIGDRSADFDPDVDTDPEPTECEGLPEDEWTDRYMEGLEKSNQAGRDRIAECAEDPACDSIDLDGE